jgi:hypothetical protein
MIEKVIRLELAGCYQLRDVLLMELRAHREQFMSCPWILDFEKEWMERYI